MTTEVVKIKHSLLDSYIQYFIFFRSEKNEAFNYTTFPNTNLCLAIYKNNNVALYYSEKENRCIVQQSQRSYFSRLLGFHKSSFQVNIEAPIDEICILFHPAALRMITAIPYNEFLNCENAFQLIFPSADVSFLELLFDEQDNEKRALLLEKLLLENLNKNILSARMKNALYLINYKYEANQDVTSLAKSLAVNESTLFRLFKNELGQNPKSFLKTIRFRNALNELSQTGEINLTEMAYKALYSDQSHFIKDFKHITGKTPGQIKKRIRTDQQIFTWIYNEKA